MSDFADEIRRWYKSGGIAIQLIFVNVAVFAVLGIFNLFINASAGIPYPITYNFNWLAGTSDLGLLV